MMNSTKLNNLKGMGILFLSGGGSEHVTELIDTEFLKIIRGHNILFIPTAKNSDMNGYKKSLKWVKAKFAVLINKDLNIEMLIDCEKSINLDKFSAVYIGGGNTYRLLSKMLESGLLLKLRDYLFAGGVIYGASAGAVIMGQDISTFIEEKYIEENKRNFYLEKNGLNLLNGLSVITHFGEGDVLKIHNFFKVSNSPVIAIPEGVAITVTLKNNLIEVFGTENALIFEKSRNVKKLFPGIVYDLNMI